MNNATMKAAQVRHLRSQIAVNPVAVTLTRDGNNVTVSATFSNITDRHIHRVTGMDAGKARTLYTVADDWTPLTPVDGEVLVTATGERLRIRRTMPEADGAGLVLVVTGEFDN